MRTFKTFYEETQPVGLIETITFEELGPVEAKIDSGNGAYNVLHGTDIQSGGTNNVSFRTVGDKVIEKPVVEYIDINIGSGNIEKRPVVAFDIMVGKKRYPGVKFSIGDRSENEYKILVGKDFIERLGGLIDVSSENNLS